MNVNQAKFQKILIVEQFQGNYLKVANYSFEGVKEPNLELFCKMFRSILSFSFRYLLRRPTIICDI